jgi:uncharacterized protein YdhG (YjbR/CyaY superfamily)
MKSNAKTVQEYLDGMPPERREAIKKVRQTILENLPEGYQEALNWGMITYQVPLEVYPDTYNKQPLMYAALVNQKNHMAVYLTGIYMDDKLSRDFQEAYQKTGKRYDIGKSCVRFRKLEDLPLPVIADSIRALEMDEFISRTKGLSARKTRKNKRPATL